MMKADSLSPTSGLSVRFGGPKRTLCPPSKRTLCPPAVESYAVDVRPYVQTRSVDSRARARVWKTPSECVRQRRARNVNSDDPSERGERG